MSANDRQVAGNHYRSGLQHWDFVALNGLDYFQGQVTKYVTRWKLKNGVDDLRKAQHFLEKYIELKGEKSLFEIWASSLKTVHSMAEFASANALDYVQRRIVEDVCRGELQRAHELLAHYIGTADGLRAECPTRNYVDQG